MLAGHICVLQPGDGIPIPPPASNLPYASNGCVCTCRALVSAQARLDVSGGLNHLGTFCGLSYSGAPVAAEDLRLRTNLSGSTGWVGAFAATAQLGRALIGRPNRARQCSAKTGFVQIVKCLGGSSAR